MTTRIYFSVISAISGIAVTAAICLAAARISSQSTPQRPQQLAATAVWRPTPSDQLRLTPHGDWIDCRQDGRQAHCLVTDAKGQPEFDGVFSTLPQDKPLESAQLVPVTSEAIAPWMWSSHAGRLVPMIHLEDGTVLAPSESVPDVQGYVERMLKFSAHLKPVPLYAQYTPAGSQ
jgi:hypothetical protein